jgi:predicted SAM-dependent methyltransferase
MVSRKTKAAYFFLMRIPMWISGRYYRYFRQPSELISVHLGPGQHEHRQLAGWISLDANIVSSRPNIWANLIDGLPFRDESVERFYSYHVVEHLPDYFLPAFFRDLYRCLIPGGGIRIGGPNSDNAIRKYFNNDLAWFPDFPDSHPSLGGRLNNFVICRNEHMTMLTESYLEELASIAGFADISFPLVARESQVAPEVLPSEDESDFCCPHTIVLEARKPGSRRVLVRRT